MLARDAKNEEGVEALSSLKTQFTIFAVNGIVPVLPRQEQPILHMTEIEIQMREAGVNVDKVKSLPYGGLVKYFRDNVEWNQKELGRRSDLTSTTICRIERGKMNGVRSLRKVIKGFGWEADDPRARFLTDKSKLERSNRKR